MYTSASLDNIFALGMHCKHPTVVNYFLRPERIMWDEMGKILNKTHIVACKHHKSFAVCSLALVSLGAAVLPLEMTNNSLL